MYSYFMTTDQQRVMLLIPFGEYRDILWKYNFDTVPFAMSDFQVDFNKFILFILNLSYYVLSPVQQLCSYFSARVCLWKKEKNSKVDCNPPRIDAI